MCTSVLSLSDPARKGALMMAFLLEMRQSPHGPTWDMGYGTLDMDKVAVTVTATVLWPRGPRDLAR